MEAKEIDDYRRMLAKNYPTMRDNFAMSALGSVIERWPWGNNMLITKSDELASMAYQIADAMMREREKK